MTETLLVIHALVTLILVVLILMQRNDNEGFGMGSSPNPMAAGMARHNPLIKMTSIIAAIFMVSSLILTIYNAREAGVSLLDEIQATGEFPGSDTTLDGSVLPRPAMSDEDLPLSSGQDNPAETGTPATEKEEKGAESNTQEGEPSPLEELPGDIPLEPEVERGSEAIPEKIDGALPDNPAVQPMVSPTSDDNPVKSSGEQLKTPQSVPSPQAKPSTGVSQ